MAESRSGTGGILAILVIIAVLLMGLYLLLFQGGGVEGDPSTQNIDLDVTPATGSGNTPAE